MSEKEVLTTIDFNRSNQYTLSIRLSTDGFSFSVREPIPDGATFYLYKEPDPALSFTANLKQIFRETDFLSLPYKQVNVLTSARTTLVPFELFDDDQSEDLFYYSHSRKENEVVLYNILRKCNVAVLFSINKSIFQFIREKYPIARFYSKTTALTEYFYAQSRPGDSKKMYVYLNANSVDVFCYENGHILLVNSFGCHTTEDRVYYLLYTWTQLGMSQQEDELYLAGNLKDKHKLLQELRRFITRVSELPFDMQTFSFNG